MTTRTVITEHTAILMPSRHLAPQPPKSSFQARVSMDYIAPDDPERKVQSYTARPCELEFALPSTYHSFICECRFRTKLEFGLLRHMDVYIKTYTLEVRGKIDGAKRTMPIEEESWDAIQDHLRNDQQVCTFVLQAHTKIEPWSIIYDFDTESRLLERLESHDPRRSRHTSMGVLLSNSRSRYVSIATQGWCPETQHTIYEKQYSKPDTVVVVEDCKTVAKQDAIVPEVTHWSQRILGWLGGARKPQKIMSSGEPPTTTIFTQDEITSGIELQSLSL